LGGAGGGPKVVLVGHSMGGAVAVNLANSGRLRHVDGLVVLDVVEGTALLNLPHMTSFIQNRPTSFKSLVAAVDYIHSRGEIKNRASLEISVPAQLVKVDDSAGSAFRWRTNLLDTEPHWRGWFEGMSGKFLAVKAPKLLMLAGVDRMDRELTIAQMQGKFQLRNMPGAGHHIHEDKPKETADAIASFLGRNGIVDLPNGPKLPPFPVHR